MVEVPANHCIVVIILCQGVQKLFNETGLILLFTIGETELCGVKICPGGIKVGPSELATEFDFTFFSHNLTPVKL